MPGLGMKRMPNQLQILTEGEPEVLLPKAKPTCSQARAMVYKPAYLLRGLSPALAANISAVLRVRLPLKPRGDKKNNNNDGKMKTLEPASNHQEGVAVEGHRCASSPTIMALEGAATETATKKVLFALLQEGRQPKGPLPVQEQPEVVMVAAVATMTETTTATSRI